MRLNLILSGMVLGLLCGRGLWAADTPTEVKLGAVTLQAPATWEKKQPKFAGIVSHEFAIAPAEGETSAGRVTFGPLGGGVKENLNRWLSSFKSEDGNPIADSAKVTKKEIAGQEVHLIDVSGTYTAPPFSGGGTFKNYRLLGAFIITADEAFYVKFMAPRKTAAGQEKGFAQMIEGLKKN